ncbi:MAG: hypothetical protein UT16_C0023G0019 [Candidatus Azambacteria bacterium GW2011_GWA2_39_10]|uniref:Uncharacterized protein n=1 Tax=Candidatus Azambacteria bacterium GW2011_GWA2_39_10 TaxID=1618611 RepID=A0A0G0NZ89_9BACT|nr:MAG: hypothetical protein UT16_C0023G0019 [Candidatus Azambacteria bacterium GW2011_GWA2_39_10]
MERADTLRACRPRTIDLDCKVHNSKMVAYLRLPPCRRRQLKIDAHGALARNLLAVFVERVGEQPDSPHRGLADASKFSADSAPRLLELVRKFCELVAGKQEEHFSVDSMTMTPLEWLFRFTSSS